MNQKRDTQLVKMIITIAIPIMLQNLLVFLTQMLDTFMLGELGDIPLTASSLANQVFFVYSLFCFGIAGGTAVLTAQYWGKQELEPIRIAMGTVLRVVALVGVVLSVVVLIFPEQIMLIFSSDPTVIEAGAEYLRYVGYMYLFYGISNTVITMLRTVESVVISVIANGTSLIVNAFLNWVLIFGNLGMPRLEIKGAAIATLVAKIAELTIVLIYLFFFDKKLKFRPVYLLKKQKLLSKDLRRYCFPVVCNELAWSMGVSIQSVLFGHLDTIAVSANTIIGIVQQIATIAIFGVANATAVIIGKTIGEGNIELARRRGRKLELFALGMGVVAAVMILLSRNFMVDFYNVSEATKALAKELLLVTSVVVFFIATSGTCIVGILRGGGDTKYSLLIELATLWGVAVPLGFIAGYVFHAPVVLIFILFKSDELLKAILCWIRLAGNRWIRNVTRSSEELSTSAS